MRTHGSVRGTGRWPWSKYCGTPRGNGEQTEKTNLLLKLVGLHLLDKMKPYLNLRPLMMITRTAPGRQKRPR